MLWAEGLGLCDAGKGGEIIESGITEMGGKLPVNTSGGLLSGLPSGVAGMAQTAEAFLQLQGNAGARQVNGAKTALVQGTTGPCGQSQCGIILTGLRRCSVSERIAIVGIGRHTLKVVDRMSRKLRW